MPKYKLIISYEGTAYGGWQVQPNALTIQALIQDALTTLLTKPAHLSGSGRTDAGVHALAQTAHFVSEKPLDSLKTLRSLNGLLPRDIRIKSVDEAPDDFHARFSAKHKTYHYNLSLGHTPDPFMRYFSHHLYQELDLEKLKTACEHFIGEHDFTSFANSASMGAAAKNPVRTLTRCHIEKMPFGLRIEVSANGFLYKMVRNIVGALIACGTGKLDPDQIPVLLKARDRRLAPLAAPAKGLFLAHVDYNS